MSRFLRSGAGVKFAFAGTSVNGTNVSPSAKAGSAHWGKPRRWSPATATLPLRIFRRIEFAISFLLLRYPDCRSAFNGGEDVNQMESSGKGGGLRKSKDVTKLPVSRKSL